MPINPSALGDSTPEGQSHQGPGVGAPTPQEAREDAAQSAEQGKRTRRTKAQMIADAVVPGNDDPVALKEANTGAKIERPWLVAVEMVREGKAKWADKTMQYALMKYDQQKAAPAFESESSGESLPFGGDGQDAPAAKSENIPPEAEVGDEVLVNGDVFRVGHGGVLTNQHSPISVEGEIVHAKRRWQRGADNEWRSADLSTADDAQPDLTAAQTDPPAPEVAQTNGQGGGEVTVQTERLPRTQEHLDDGSIKIGTGILEKIGMPQVEQFASASQFQVGPITISRAIYDDGRRTVETLSDGREAEVITAAVEGFELLDNTVEFVARRFRGQLISFLEATGAVKQPVS